MLRLVMRATMIAVVLAVGFVLYLVYQEERTPQWPTNPPGAVSPTPTRPPPAMQSAPPAVPQGSALSPVPSASNAGAATATTGTATPGTATAPTAPSGQAPAGTDPLSAALQRLREAAPAGAGQVTVTAPIPGSPAPGPSTAPSTTTAAGTPPPASAAANPPGVAAPGAGLTSPSTNADNSAPGVPPPIDAGGGTPLAPPADNSALGTAGQSGGLPPPIPLTPSENGTPSGAGANLPNVTASGTRWALRGGNGGMSLSIDLGGGQVAHVVVAPQFGNLDRAGVEDRVNWLRQSILARWGDRGGTYIYRRDGSIFRTQ